jgi:hypothetical protein
VREGTPVTVLFGLFILIVYIGGYIWNLQVQNDRLYEVAIEQKEELQEIRKENQDLQALVDVMFQYINKSPNIAPPHDISIDPEFDPIHRHNNKPL